MKLGIIISTNEIEAIWNAFRLANFSKKEGDVVKVFLTAKAVDYEDASSEKFPAKNEAEKFLSSGGIILACTTCIKSRNRQGDALCPLSNMRELHNIIKESDKVVCY